MTTRTIEQTAQRNAFNGFMASYFLILVLAFALESFHVLNNTYLSFGVITISFFVPLLTFLIYGKTGLASLNFGQPKSKFIFNGMNLVVTLAFSIASALAGTAIAVIFTRAFKEFIYDPFSFSFWLSFSIAAWLYAYTILAQRIKTIDIVNLIGFYLIGGVAVSAIFNPNPQWWDESVSYLGMNQLPSAKVFNACIIISGLLLLTLSNFIIGQFQRLKEKDALSDRYFKLYRVAFIIAPIGLACVGLFPYGSSPLHSVLHNLSAFSAFGIFGLVMASLYFSMKSTLSKYFLRINYLLLLAMVAGFALYVIGYFTLAINEIFAFGVISIWLVLFLSNISVQTNG